MNKNIESDLRRAKVLLKQKRIVDAIAVLESLRTKHPDEFEVVTLLGFSYLMIGDGNRALDMLSYASALRPGNIIVNNAIGLILARNGDFDRALEFFEWTLYLDPMNIEALRSRGGVFVQLGRFDEAIREWKKLGEEAEEMIEVQYNLGFIYEHRNDFANAERHYRQVLMLPDADDRHELARRGLARIAEGRGRPEHGE